MPMVRRVIRPIVGIAILGVALAMIPASPAAAASYSTFVGCSVSASPIPSHVCQIGDEPGAYFEADSEVEYEVCVTFPGAQTVCAEEQLVEAEVLYVNAITTNIVGNHLVSWYVEGVEVASWSFRMDPAPPPPAPTPGPRSPTGAVANPPVTPPTVLGCVGRSGFLFAGHPSRCIEYRGGQQVHVNEIWMKGLRWSAWGKEDATAHGRWKYCGMGRCFSGPLKAVASERILACGRYAYTRLNVHLVGIDRRNHNYALKLPAC